MKKEETTTVWNADFITEIKQIIDKARQRAYAAINSAISLHRGEY